MKKNSKIKKLKTTVSTTINRKKKRGPFLWVQKVYFYLQFFFQDQEIDTFKIVKLSRSRNETEWTCFGELDLNYYFGRVKLAGLGYRAKKQQNEEEGNQL